MPSDAKILTFVFGSKSQPHEFRIFSDVLFKKIENLLAPKSHEKLTNSLQNIQRMTLKELRNFFSVDQQTKMMLLIASILKSYTKPEYLKADRDHAKKTLSALYQEMINKKLVTLIKLESENLKNSHVSFSHRFYRDIIFIVTPTADVRFFDCHFDHCHFDVPFDAPYTTDHAAVILENCQLTETKFYGDCQSIQITGSAKSSKLAQCGFEDTLTLPQIDEKIPLGASTFSDMQLITLCRQHALPKPSENIQTHYHPVAFVVPLINACLTTLENPYEDVTLSYHDSHVGVQSLRVANKVPTTTTHVATLPADLEKISYDDFFLTPLRLAHSNIVLDLTNTTLPNQTLMSGILKKAVDITAHRHTPFRSRITIPIDQFFNTNKREDISLIKLTGNYSKKMPPLNCADTDISDLNFVGIEVLNKVELHNTTIDRKKFIWFLRLRLFSKLTQVNLSRTDVTGLDLSELDFTDIIFNDTQDFSGCTLTATQANLLAERGLKKLSRVTIASVSDTTFSKNFNDNMICDNIRITGKNDLMLLKSIPDIKHGENTMITLHQLFALLNDNTKIDLSAYHMEPIEFKKLFILMRRNSAMIPKSTALVALIKWIAAESERLKITADISGFKMTAVDLSDLCLSRFVMKKCYFDRVIFDGSELSHAQFDKSVFHLCDFNKISFGVTTSFKNCFFKEPHCTNIIYSRVNAHGKTVPLNCEPKEFYDLVKSHYDILLENKAKLFHRFFENTRKQLEAKPWPFVAAVAINEQVRRSPRSKPNLTTQAMARC